MDTCGTERVTGAMSWWSLKASLICFQAADARWETTFAQRNPTQDGGRCEPCYLVRV